MRQGKLLNADHCERDQDPICHGPEPIAEISKPVASCNRVVEVIAASL